MMKTRAALLLPKKQTVTTKEHLSKHDREIADIRGILKQQAEQHAREATEMWTLLGKLAKGTEAAQRESRELWAAVRATQATLKAFIESMRRGANGNRKR
jgi:hypothetical protein